MFQDGGWCEMKILVLSDSHSGLSFMRLCIRQVLPDAVVHLGDYYEDGSVMAKENPELPFYQVPGNCDRYRCIAWQQEILAIPVGGVKLYMTHGHKHGVKSGTGRLLEAARACGAGAALYGHTHRAECRQEPDGLWVLNPGTCSHFGGSAGLMVIENNKITSCRILRQEDLEENL